MFLKSLVVSCVVKFNACRFFVLKIKTRLSGLNLFRLVTTSDLKHLYYLACDPFTVRESKSCRHGVRVFSI